MRGDDDAGFFERSLKTWSRVIREFHPTSAGMVSRGLVEI